LLAAGLRAASDPGASAAAIFSVTDYTPKQRKLRRRRIKGPLVCWFGGHCGARSRTSRNWSASNVFMKGGEVVRNDLNGGGTLIQPRRKNNRSFLQNLCFPSTVRFS